MRAALVRSLAFAAAVALAGCASGPRSGASRPATPVDPARDGPEANPPAHLEQVPDAVPRVESIRVGGPNKPYEALGRTYVPQTNDAPLVERGLASWYGRKFQGKRTSSGEPYDMYAMTAAHPTMAIPSYARVRNPANGREVIVRVNDRGPFHPGRIIDLSYTAALKLDLLRGVAPVEVERITSDEIRAGTWRRPGADDTRWARAAEAPTPPTPASTGGVAAVVVQGAAVASVAVTPTDSASLADRAEAVGPSASSTGATMPFASSDATTIARGYWIQLGAFRERAGAIDFQRKVGDAMGALASRLVVVDEATLWRLQAGPYASREEARGAADDVRGALSLVPVIVERR